MYSVGRCSILLILITIPFVLQADETLFNQVYIDAQAEREVENDQLEVSLMVEKQGSRPEEIAAEVNETMEWALDTAGDVKDVDVSTRSYQTYPIYKNRVIVGWRATQELHLKSVKIPELTDLVGELQEKLQVNSMNFSPTRETRVNMENELISEAMVAFRERAEIIKQHMNEKNYRIVSLNINTGQSGPVMYREAFMAKAMMDTAVEPAPAVEAGTSKVIVTVSGSIQFF